MSNRRRLYVHVLTALALLLAAAAHARAADVYVSAGADLQAAIDAARPGDVLLLQPGATFVGNFHLPVHGGTTYVTIRSAASNAQLPPDGTRISPADAPLLPKIRSINSLPALATRPGAAYWRLQFLEFPATERGYYDIVALGDGSSAQNALEHVPHHLILDRVYVHGDRLHGQKRGIALNSAATSIINSHVSGIRAIGQDSMAVGGWNGPGPFTIDNNFLEAAGEVVLFGGEDPAIPGLVPSDLEVVRNTISRPLSWRDPVVPAPDGVQVFVSGGGNVIKGLRAYRVVARRPAHIYTATSRPSEEVGVSVLSGSRVTISWNPVPDATGYDVYVRTGTGSEVYWPVADTTFVDDGTVPGTAGAPPHPTQWQVKNLIELKNARRVRIAGNLLQHNWAHAQTGSAILFTPRNQNGACTWCVVEDVTFEYNVLQGSGAGIVILGRDDEQPSQQTSGIRIRHNVLSDMGYEWGGNGGFLQLLDAPRDVVVDHNTVIAELASGVLAVDGPPVYGFVFTNNVARHNPYGIIGQNHGVGMDTIAAFFPDGVITHNVLAAPPEPYSYPAVTWFPSAAEFEAHFVDYAAGNFALKPGTDWAGAGTDGQDLGAHTGSLAGPAPPRAPVNLRLSSQAR